jgi:hypothetical protein
LKALLVALIVALCSGAAFSAPDINPSPRDRIEVVGTMPEHVEAVVQEDWYTTNDSFFCEKLASEAGFTPLRFLRIAKLISKPDGQRTWVVWRDEVLAGRCGWALKQIVVYVDSKASGLLPVRVSNIPTRIAYVCGAREHCENSWASNDDSTKPTHHFCKFSEIGGMGSGISQNPCAYFDEKYRGTAEGNTSTFFVPSSTLFNSAS